MANNRMNNNYPCRNSYDDNRTTIYYDDSSCNYTYRPDSGKTRRPHLRHSEEARAITRAKGRRQNIFLSSAAIALVALVAVGVMAFGGVFNSSVKNADTAPTSISTQADKGANKAAQTAKQAEQKTEAKQDDTDAQQTYVGTTAQTSQDDQQTYVQTADVQTQSSDQNTQSSEDRIDTVNGERIYRDTKRQAPDQTGTPAHFYANGKTSYGFNWDYDTDNANFIVKCDYNFDQQQYDFTFYGTAPGTAHVTLYYFTSDSDKVPVNLTVNVDNDLNVSVG